MLINILYGLPTMASCLLLESLLLLIVLRYYAGSEMQVKTPDYTDVFTPNEIFDGRKLMC